MVLFLPKFIHQEELESKLFSRFCFSRLTCTLGCRPCIGRCSDGCLFLTGKFDYRSNTSSFFVFSFIGCVCSFLGPEVALQTSLYWYLVVAQAKLGEFGPAGGGMKEEAQRKS